MKQQFALIALVFTMDYKTCKDRMEEQKQRGHSILSKYLNYLENTANLFKNLNCAQDKNIVSMALLNLHESQKIIEDVLMSAEQLGVLQYKIRTKSFWNLVVNYVADLSQETSQNTIR